MGGALCWNRRRVVVILEGDTGGESLMGSDEEESAFFLSSPHVGVLGLHERYPECATSTI